MRTIGIANSSTLVASDDLLTSPGSVVGTIAYMSPEQARGESLDARSDLFSFGLVLYERPTGRLAFDGSTPAVLFTALLTSDPLPAIEVNPSLPPRLNDIIAKALEKDREVRYQHATEIRADLKRLQRSLHSDQGSLATPPNGVAVIDRSVKPIEPVSEAPRRRGLRRTRNLLVLVALVLVTASIAIFLHLGERTSPLELRPQQITTNSAERPVYSACISPDGKYVAYEEQGEIVVSLIASQESRILKKPSSFLARIDGGRWGGFRTVHICWRARKVLGPLAPIRASGTFQPLQEVRVDLLRGLPVRVSHQMDS